jgi:hypothetical protein
MAHFVFAIAVALVAVVAVAVLGFPIDFSRKVDLRIGSDTLAVCVHPCSAYMACVVVVHQWGILMVVGRYVLKKRKLRQHQHLPQECQHSMTNQRFIFFRFSEFAAED